jgi:hypothetical protein
VPCSTRSLGDAALARTGLRIARFDGHDAMRPDGSLLSTLRRYPDGQSQEAVQAILRVARG